MDVVELRSWADRLVKDLSPTPATMVVRLTDDEEMRQLNHHYRNQDKATDVLSFPGSETPDGSHLGDVVIAMGVAARQASEREHSTMRELKILALHGVLHCMGYDHERDDGEMEEIERKLREEWL